MTSIHPPKLLAISIFIFSLLFFSVIKTTALFVDKTTPLTGQTAAPVKQFTKQTKPLERNITVQQTAPTQEIVQSQPALENKAITPVQERSEIQELVAQRQESARTLANTAPEPVELSPEFQGFISKVINGRPDQVRGVYVDGVLSLEVVQQPENDAAYVSTEMNTATLFRSASRNGVTGLLAHNYLSGLLFYNLQLGQELRIVYGNGSFHRYTISEISGFQKLSPNSLQSELVDLANGEVVSTSQVFNRFYTGSPKVTLQTCLERNGISNWGLTFVVATPID